MGAQWKHAGRQASNNKKGQIVGKLVKEIIVSTKLGGPDPAGNFRLRSALEDARKNSVPRDTIDRAVKRGAGLLDDPVTYETMTYEGFAPHQVPVMVECLTDNRNRTAADVRVLFRKGQLGAAGSVAWMFDRKGVIEAHSTQTGVDLETVAIEAGADDVTPIKAGEGQPTGGTMARFICGTSDLDAVSKALAAVNWNVLTSEMSYLAKNFVELDEAKMKEVGEFLGEIDDHDDVHRIYVGLKPQE
ncbi:MAG: YebC/PmpR family DNA-binding transcriptional regulator [Bdellovibrionales bacterium]|nr:YebC/PmpR family DNA-binding transcriptional regulator [Bdellovibrionales bacterium]